MEAKHTAGKWEVSKETNGLFVHAKTGDTGLNDAICLIYTDKPNFHADKAEANAKLIAAAPELLEACERALSWFYLNLKRGSKEPACLSELTAAIKAATI